MTRTLIDFGPPVSEILAGGRSPSTWQELMTREGAVTDWLARSSSWIGFLDDALPYLRQGPLFGHGIDVLTKDARRADRKPERRAGRPRAERFQAGDTVTAFRQAGGISDSESLAPRPTGSERRWARQQAWGQPQPQAAKCLEQPSKASRELLGRLAGGAYAADVRGELKPGGRFADRRTAGKDHVFNLSRPVGPPGGIEAAEHARKALALRLARRTAGRLHVPDVNRSILDGKRPTPQESDRARLEDQWAASVAGPPAPAELLDAGYQLRPGKVPNIPRDEADSEANSNFEAGRGLPPTEESWRTRRNVRPSAYPVAGRGNVDPVEAGVEGPYESAAFAAPGLRSRFLTSQRGLRPADAASMAVVEAVEEEAVSHEDLSTLSAKLKQILDEEARRHGIDV